MSDAKLVGYLNASAGPGRPVVMVFHEWWGLNAQIRGVVDRLAEERFVAFAPDLFHGKIATDSASAEKLMSELDWNRAGAEMKTAAEALKERNPAAQLGCLGFCMGGAASLMAASLIPELRAGVTFYGIPSGADLTKIKAKVQGHFAQHDDWCSPERVDALERMLKKAGVQVEIHRYDASHAFMNEKRPVYSPQNAQLAWSRTLSFLHSSLR
jgi:carboxymethylenebutenolidase